MAEDEKKKYQVKPVQQDQWTKWCSYLCMDHLWKTLLAMPQQPLSFSLGATYDTLHLLLICIIGIEVSCFLKRKKNKQVCTTAHILGACTVAHILS